MTNEISEHSREDHRDSESLLSAYMDHSLPETERLAFEKELAGDPFLADALEGLKQGDPDTVARSVKQLKKQLRRQVHAKTGRGRQQSPVIEPYIYWTIGIILVLAAAAYLVLQMLRHR